MILKLQGALGLAKPRANAKFAMSPPECRLPNWFKLALKKWLAQFHVRFRPEIRAYFEEQEKAGRGRMTYRPVMRGYAYRLDFVAKN